MKKLARDGATEPVSRDQILGSDQGRMEKIIQGKIIFPVQLTMSRISNLTQLVHTLL